MYSGQVLRGSVTRIPDLLDTLRQEYETIGQEMSVYKAQRDDYERKRVHFPACCLLFHHCVPCLFSQLTRCCLLAHVLRQMPAVLSLCGAASEPKPSLPAPISYDMMHPLHPYPL